MSRVRHTTGRRRRKHEEHANHEAWAIPYADLLTLLLAFFVVMYAISSVNAGKYRVLSDSLFAAFRGTPRTMTPVQVGEKQVGEGADMQTTTVQQALIDGKAQSRLAPVPVDTRAGPQPIKLPPQAAAAAAALSRLADEVEQAMSELVKKNMVTVRRNDFWIEVEMRTDILFPSGSAKLAPNATGIIEKLGSVLAPFPNPIRVEGHTDNMPIKTVVFYSNWELSAARAGSVVRVLSDHGVAPGRLAVIGYGQERPLQTNGTAGGRNANRRVVVVILSTELMRQTDPTKMSATAGGPDTAGANSAGSVAPSTAASTSVAPSTAASTSAAPNSGAIADPGGVPVPSSGGALASPGDAAQAMPVPAVETPPPASEQTTRALPTPSNTTLAQNLHRQ